MRRNIAILHVAIALVVGFSVACASLKRGPIDVVQFAPIRSPQKNLVLLSSYEYLGDLSVELGQHGFLFRSPAKYGLIIEKRHRDNCAFTPNAIYTFTVTVIDMESNQVVMVLRQTGADGACTTVGPVWPTIAEAIVDNWGTPAAGSVQNPTEDVRPPAVAGGTGTAFIVHPDGLLLTAHHVIEHATSIAVSCDGQPAVPAVVTANSPTIDLALLEAAGDLGTESFLRLSLARVPSLGDRVFTIGFPTPSLLGPDPKYTNGTVSALSGPGGDASFLQISVPIQPGNSGGPLVDEETGDVIGVVVATADAPIFIAVTDSIPQNVNWAIKGVFASALFTPPPPDAASATDGADMIERVTEATCLVRATGSEQ